MGACHSDSPGGSPGEAANQPIRTGKTVCARGGAGGGRTRVPCTEPNLTRALNCRPFSTMHQRSIRPPPPRLDLFAVQLPQAIVGCTMTPIIATKDPCDRPEVRWERRRADGKTWEVKGVGWEYTPTKSDENCTIRCVLNATEGERKAESVVIAPPPPPAKRTLVVARRDSRSNQSTSDGAVGPETPASPPCADTSSRSRRRSETWRVLSWNTLADRAVAQWDNACDKHVLMWPFRAQNLLRHIESQEPDIVCLQEVDKKHFCPFWQQFMGQSFDSEFAGGHYGCAIFFRKSRFTLVRSQVVSLESEIERLYGDVRSMCKRQAGDERTAEEEVRLIKVQRKALIFELAPKRGGVAAQSRDEHLFVATTHLYRSDKKPYAFIRLLQTHALLARLAQATSGVSEPKVVVAGDFNSEPDSTICAYMRQGTVKQTHFDVLSSPLLRACVSDAKSPRLRHEFRFRSTYFEVMGSDPSYCRKSKTPTPAVEYIWYTRSKGLQVRGVVGIPEAERTAFPLVSRISSDHQLLVAEFDTGHGILDEKGQGQGQHDKQIMARSARHHRNSKSDAPDIASKIRMVCFWYAFYFLFFRLSCAIDFVFSSCLFALA